MAEERMVLLLSGGIDSPVAGYMMARQDIELLALSGYVNPEGDEAQTEKMKRIVAAIERASEGKVSLFMFSQRIAQSVFSRSSRPGLTCVLCKRMMLRVAQNLAMDKGASAIIMGDSMGQVASQTLQNMHVIEEAVEIPIVRPLVGLDKVEITRMAEAIGTFQLSNIKAAGCAFLPAQPATRARLEDVLAVEQEIGITDLTDETSATIGRIL